MTSNLPSAPLTAAECHCQAGLGQCRGGQQRQQALRRVAIARALITEPEMVFADEPAAALDLVTLEPRVRQV